MPRLGAYASASVGVEDVGYELARGLSTQISQTEKPKIMALVWNREHVW